MENIQKIKYYSGLWLITKTRRILQLDYFTDDMWVAHLNCDTSKSGSLYSKQYLEICVPCAYQRGDTVWYKHLLCTVSNARIKKETDGRFTVVYSLLYNGKMYEASSNEIRPINEWN